MNLETDRVLALAKLARIALTDQEASALTADLDNILDYVDQLASVNTEGVEPTFNPFAQVNGSREDEIRPCLPLEEWIELAPDAAGRSIRVPRVIG